MKPSKVLLKLKQNLLLLLVLDYIWQLTLCSNYEHSALVIYGGGALIGLLVLAFLWSGCWIRQRACAYVMALPLLFGVLEIIKMFMWETSLTSSLGIGVSLLNAVVIGFGCLYLFSEAEEGRAFLNRYLSAITLITLVCMVLVLLGYAMNRSISLFHGTFVFGMSYSSSGRLVISMLGWHQYRTGFLATVFFFISIYLYLEYKSVRALLQLLAAEGVFATITVLSSSRNAWLGLMIGCFLLLFLWLRSIGSRLRRIFLILTGVGLTACAVAVYLSNAFYAYVVHSRRDVFYGIATLTSRTTIWKGFFSMVREYPRALLTGLPYGSLMEIMNEHIQLTDDITNMHNGYIQVLCLMGLPGLILVLLFTYQWAVCVIRVLTDRTGKIDTSYKMLAIATIVTFLENSFELLLFTVPSTGAVYNFLFFMLMGCLFQMTLGDQAEGWQLSSGKKRRVYACSACACLLPVMLLGISYWGLPETENLPDTVTASTYTVDSEAEVRTAPGVTEDMLTAVFWQDPEHGDEVILSAEEIAALNAANAQTLTSSTGLSLDLDTINEEVEGFFVADLVNTCSVPEKCEEYYVDGTATTPEYWQTHVANMNVEAIPEQVSVRFGYSVARTTLRQLPCRDYVGEGDDLLFDEMTRSDFNPFEPLAVVHESKDGDWYYVLMDGYAGWIEKEYVALCESREEWKTREQARNASFLLVKSREIRLEDEPYDAAVSGLIIPMGTRLTLAAGDDIPTTFNRRSSYGCYVVLIPTRGQDGFLQDSYCLIPANNQVNVGYLPYTTNNILSQAFAGLGARYGWSGDYHAWDCSGYTRAIYSCFGISIPRGSSGQMHMSGTSLGTFSGMNEQGRLEAIETLEIGSLLYFEGHVMLYLGTIDEEPYVISSVASICLKNEGEFQVSEPIDINTVSVNSLTQTFRASGYSWLNAMECWNTIQ